MRMWMVNPKIMCDKHLLGEHVELHMFVGTIINGVDVTGYINKNLLELKSVQSRHIELVEEIKRRGFKHESFFPVISWDCVKEQYGSLYDKEIDVKGSFKELIKRCPRCRQKAEELSEEYKMKTKQTTLEDFGLTFKNEKVKKDVQTRRK